MNAGKKLLVVLFSLGVAFGASAQRGFHGGGFYHGGGVVFAPRTYVGVGFGYGLGYPYYPFGYGFGPYGPYPPYYYGNGAMPTRLGLQIEGIKNDYNARIKDVRHDKSIDRKERRTQIDQLKHDRDAAVIQARKDYFYNSSRRNYNNNGQQGNGNQQQGNGNQGNGNQGNGNQQPSNGNGQQPNKSSGSSNGSDQPEYQERGPANSNQ
jgi:hypothetical protein